MRKRMLAMLLACCLIGGTLSGCGGKTENSTESSQASAETAKTEQEDTSGEKEQPENITIEFFNQKQEEAAQQAYRNAAEDFHKEYPYITIEINTVPDSDKSFMENLHHRPSSRVQKQDSVSIYQTSRLFRMQYLLF